MSRTLCPTATPRYSTLFETAKPAQPFGFFLLENLLTARAGSMFPTNGAGPDEDVNIYLNHLLGRFLRGECDPAVQFGSGALFNPPAKTATPRQRSEYYRVNADHRLLHLGLFGRGDGLRRRSTLHGLSTAETHSRDMAAGQACYEAAANHWRGRHGSNPALIDLMEKLARNFEDYVHVLGALATRQLGLGAQVTDDDLARLLPPDTTATTRTVTDLLDAPPPPEAVDALLDLWLSHGKNPGPATAARLRDMAKRLGVELKVD